MRLAALFAALTALSGCAAGPCPVSSVYELDALRAQGEGSYGYVCAFQGKVIAGTTSSDGSSTFLLDVSSSDGFRCSTLLCCFNVSAPEPGQTAWVYVLGVFGAPRAKERLSIPHGQAVIDVAAMWNRNTGWRGIDPAYQSIGDAWFAGSDPSNHVLR